MRNRDHEILPEDTKSLTYSSISMAQKWGFSRENKGDFLKGFSGKSGFFFLTNEGFVEKERQVWVLQRQRKEEEEEEEDDDRIRR